MLPAILANAQIGSTNTPIIYVDSNDHNVYEWAISGRHKDANDVLFDFRYVKNTVWFKKGGAIIKSRNGTISMTEYQGWKTLWLDDGLLALHKDELFTMYKDGSSSLSYEFDSGRIVVFRDAMYNVVNVNIYYEWVKAGLNVRGYKMQQYK